VGRFSSTPSVLSLDIRGAQHVVELKECGTFAGIKVREGEGRKKAGEKQAGEKDGWSEG